MSEVSILTDERRASGSLYVTHDVFETDDCANAYLLRTLNHFLERVVSERRVAYLWWVLYRQYTRVTGPGGNCV